MDRIQSDIAKAKGLGSAHHGAEHWMAQRLTALANIPLIIWFIYSVMHLRGVNQSEFVLWLAEPVNAVLTILLILNISYHAVLGSQVIVEDYISCKVLRMAKLIGQKLFFIAFSVACIFSVLTIAL